MLIRLHFIKHTMQHFLHLFFMSCQVRAISIIKLRSINFAVKSHRYVQIKCRKTISFAKFHNLPNFFFIGFQFFRIIKFQICSRLSINGNFHFGAGVITVRRFHHQLKR